jgi:hypothetical protein
MNLALLDHMERRALFLTVRTEKGKYVDIFCPLLSLGKGDINGISPSAGKKKNK